MECIYYFNKMAFTGFNLHYIFLSFLLIFLMILQFDDEIYIYIYMYILFMFDEQTNRIINIEFS